MRQAQIAFVITVHFLPYIHNERCFPLPLLSEDCNSLEHSAEAIADVDYAHIFLKLLVISMQFAYLQE